MFILDKTGENKSTLAGWTTERAVFPLWLPDSNLVFYLTEDSLFEINTDTKEKVNIGDLDKPQDMVLSPNMDCILIRTFDGNWHLWVYKVKDNELVSLTDIRPSNQKNYYFGNIYGSMWDFKAPSWSPDGKWIAYLSDDKAELINIDDGSYFTLPGNPYSGFLGYDLVWLK